MFLLLNVSVRDSIINQTLNNSDCPFLLFKYLKKTLIKASVVYSTWGSRCDKVVFVSDKREDEIELPVMQVNITGRNNLWGKTREAVLRAWREYATDVDWILKVTI